MIMAVPIGMVAVFASIEIVMLLFNGEQDEE